jgi:NitT/TauT family transport system substrate-binding protein
MSASKLLVMVGVVVATIGAGEAVAREKVKWVNDWIPTGDKAVVYIGVHSGIFAAEGLDVEITSGRGSADAVTKIASGVAEVGTSGISALMQARAETSAPVKAILSIYTKQPDAIFTAEASGITSLKQLEGTAVAIAPFSSSNVMWPLVLRANGIDAARIELIKADPPTLGPMLATGKVPAIVAWMPNTPQFEKLLVAAGKRIKVIPWFDYGFEGYAFLLLASERMIRERPETLRKLVRAYRKAMEVGLADPKLAGDSLKALVPEIEAAIAMEQWKASIPLIVNEVTVKHGKGAFDPALLKETWAWVSKSLNIPMERLDLQALADRSFAN